MKLKLKNVEKMITFNLKIDKKENFYVNIFLLSIMTNYVKS